MFLKNDCEPREYQKAIAETASKNNTLVVLPTGMGKTLIAVLVGVDRLEKYPENKILITAPTRPLNAQHKKSFEQFTTINPEEIVLVTGKIEPEERQQLYKKAKIIVATPQTIKNDISNDRLSLEDFSFVVFDEAHRCVKDYAYNYIAKKYKEQSKHMLILGLTASPGGTHEKINEIKQNLFIEAVEIRTEADVDVEKYVKPVEIEWVYVDFPEEFKKIKILLEECLRDDIYWLKEHHFVKSYKPSKKQLLMLQQKLTGKYMQGAKNYSLFWIVIRLAESIKLEHAIELLETQGIHFLYDYFNRISKSKKRTDVKLMKDPRIREVIALADELQTKSIEHPKLEKLKNIVKELAKPEIKIIVFANYRATTARIKDMLCSEGIKAEEFIGQATKERKGLTQEKQIELLKKFRETEFNVLVATSVGEEGLDVPAVDYAIFYEPIPSEIRTIQRRGRVGRQTAGKTIFLITRGTRDESYYWIAFHKERKMKNILYDMKNKVKKENLKDWL